MDLTILTSATGDQLVGLEDVKDALDITDSLRDQTLTRMIRRCSRRIESSLGRDLGVQVYRAALPGYGRTELRLPAYPIRHVFKVFDGTDTGSGARELTSTEYAVDTKAGMLSRQDGFMWSFQSQRDVVTFPEPGQEAPRYLVEFSAGYILPAGKDSTADGTTSTGCTLEQDLQDACIGLVRNVWHTRTQASNVTSKKVGDLSISYGTPSSGLPDEVNAILQPYRSVV